MNTGMSKTQASTDMGSQSFSDSTDDGSAKLLFRFAILPVILAVIATIVFLAGALISFFLLQQREYQYAYNGLVKVSAEATTNFQKVCSSVAFNL
jgi:flagellar basal body-associated protein FliL